MPTRSKVKQRKTAKKKAASSKTKSDYLKFAAGVKARDKDNQKAKKKGVYVL